MCFPRDRTPYSSYQKNSNFYEAQFLYRIRRKFLWIYASRDENVCKQVFLQPVTNCGIYLMHKRFIILQQVSLSPDISLLVYPSDASLKPRILIKLSFMSPTQCLTLQPPFLFSSLPLFPYSSILYFFNAALPGINYVITWQLVPKFVDIGVNYVIVKIGNKLVFVK